MPKLRFSFLLFLTAIFWNSTALRAQYYTNQNKVWAFGEGQGLDFSSGSPVLISTSMHTQEGSAAVSDASGNLLFYTDGTYVWNKLGNIMPHGSNIVPYYTQSATQAAVIAPVLSNPEQYYVFSLEHYYGWGRLSYSVVDVTLDGGLGDLVSGHIGLPLDTGLNEQMITVAGENCNLWLLVHDRDEAKFRAYEITSAGVSATPVTSSVGFFDSCNALGGIRISHDRRHLACMNRTLTSAAPHRAELYDFDPATGLVSNCRVFKFDQHFYGAEFSPDDSKLYAFSLTGQIYQYDISIPDALFIGSTEYEVVSYPFTGPGNKGGDMRLAADGKIYFSGAASHIDRINNPNLPGAACGYEANVFSFAPELGRTGMCNHFWNTLPPTITGSHSLCFGTEGALFTTAEGGSWSSSNTAVVSVMPDTGRVFALGVGIATITYTSPCGESYFTVSVSPFPSAIAGSGDTAICAGHNVSLTNASTGGTWASGNTAVASVDSTTGLMHAVAPGTAIITYTSAAGCAVTDTIGVMDCSPSAVNEIIPGDVQVFPNPAQNKLSVYVPVEASTGTIEIYDMTGVLQVTKKIEPGNAQEVDISAFAPGIYTLRLRVNGSAINKRFQKVAAVR